MDRWQEVHIGFSLTAARKQAQEESEATALEQAIPVRQQAVVRAVDAPGHVPSFPGPLSEGSLYTPVSAHLLKSGDTRILLRLLAVFGKPSSHWQRTEHRDIAVPTTLEKPLCGKG